MSPRVPIVQIFHEDVFRPVRASSGIRDAIGSLPQHPELDLPFFAGTGPNYLAANWRAKIPRDKACGQAESAVAIPTRYP